MCEENTLLLCVIATNPLALHCALAVEGEFIPVRSEELDLGNIDGLLLLPITIEHTIDERSPLCGHTHDSLEALNAEVVVTFEGTTEMGAPAWSPGCIQRESFSVVLPFE